MTATMANRSAKAAVLGALLQRAIWDAWGECPFNLDDCTGLGEDLLRGGVTVQDRDKLRARAAVRSAVRSGVLEKPDYCQLCGSPTPRERLHGHHARYDRPTIVTWVCDACHRDLHVLLERRV